MYNEYDDIITEKHDRSSTSKKSDAKIYWIDDKRLATSLSSEVSGSPTKEIDIVKNERDRRKLIRCMRIVSQNFWLNIESWHNKFISEDNVNRIKNLLRIMVHIYGFKLALMVYDEEYFPFGRVSIKTGKTSHKTVKDLVHGSIEHFGFKTIENV
ncbi:hypothetical protein RhiirA4_525707 [Rhizophagus irregularis]|uniref:Uncharacterized protein n=1 Tax=Rhizophagus irregularis TaxID=588596 RepID=A0A2I1GPW2_9GLOM|nr:hypothetical protein RhiirA4_525707 [Rhizophagus irregularis]